MITVCRCQRTTGDGLINRTQRRITRGDAFADLAEYFLRDVPTLSVPCDQYIDSMGQGETAQA